MTEQNDLQKLSSEQLEALSDGQKATFLAMDSQDQDFTARTFSPKDIPVFLSRKREQMERNQAQKQRIADIRARVAAAGTEAMPPQELGVKGVLGGIAGAAGVGAATAAVASMDDSGSWEVENPKRAIKTALSRLRSEFGKKEKTDFDHERTNDLVHATVYVVRRSQGKSSKRRDEDLIPALDITLTPNPAASRVEVKIGELEKETLFDAAKDFSKKGFDILKQGARALSRKKKMDAGDIFDLAGDSLDTAFDIGAAVKDLNLKKKSWTYLGEVFEPLEKAYRDLRKAQTEREQKAIGLWVQYENCPTCGVAFMVDEDQCRVCDTPRPPKPDVSDPRQAVS